MAIRGGRTTAGCGEESGESGPWPCAAPGHAAQAAAIAHDLNNLFTVMIAGAQVSLRTGHMAEMRRSLEEIVGAGSMAARLTRQLLDLGRPGAPPGCVDLNSVIEGLADVLRVTLGPAVALEFHTWHRPLNVRMSATDVERVLLNLAGNARDAMSDSGSLRVEARPFVGSSSANRYALLVVADTGCGMDSTTTSRIYEPFFTTKPGKGTGLGLATVHRLVTSCGGHIHVDSEPRSGTVFRLLLPQDPAAEGSPADGTEE